MKKLKNKRKNIILILFIITFLLITTTMFNFKEQIISAKNTDEKFSGVTTDSLAVEILENGETIAGSGQDSKNGILFEKMLETNEKFCIGKRYDEEIKIKNVGIADVYARIEIIKTWTDAENNVNEELDSNKINIDILEENGWLVDTNNSNSRRIVAYYKYILSSESETNPAFEYINIDSDIQNQFETINNNGNISLTNKYDGYFANIEVDANLVQSHNGVDAIKEQWGVNAEINENGEIVSVSPIG